MGLIYLYHVRNRQWFISRYFPDIGLDRLTFIYLFIHSFIHSIGMRRMRRFLAVLRSFFHSSLLCTFSCHPSPPTIFHPLSPHLAVHFLVYLSTLLFPISYIIPFWEFYFLPFSVHSQTNVIYLTLLSLL